MTELIARFDVVVGDFWEPHAAPSEESINAINRHFGILLPRELLEFARYSKSFSSFFLSLGPDYDAHSHIISRNNYWRCESEVALIPKNLVMINDGFMNDDFWCFNIASGTIIQYPVEYWAPDDCPVNPRDHYSNFVEFITQIIVDYEKRSVRT